MNVVVSCVPTSEGEGEERDEKEAAEAAEAAETATGACEGRALFGGGRITFRCLCQWNRGRCCGNPLKRPCARPLAAGPNPKPLTGTFESSDTAHKHTRARKVAG